MSPREQAAGRIAAELERIGQELRTGYAAAVRAIDSVPFSGPVAQLVDRRLDAHTAELTAILTTLGVTTTVPG
jgi:hypothetical protein